MHAPIPKPPFRDILRVIIAWLLVVLVMASLFALTGCARKKEVEATAATETTQATQASSTNNQHGSAQGVARIDYVEHLQVRPSTTTTVRIPGSISQPFSHTEDGITTTITPRPDGTKDVHTHVPADTQRTLLPRATLSGSVAGAQTQQAGTAHTQETAVKSDSVSRTGTQQGLHWGWKVGGGILALLLLIGLLLRYAAKIKAAIPLPF